MRFPIARKVSKRFVAGETLAEALDAVVKLRKEGFLVSLDLLGENVDGMGEADLAVQEVLDAVRALKAGNLSCNLSIKLTQLGLDLNYDKTRENLQKIASEVEGSLIKLRVDMESSDYTESTMNMVSELRQEYDFVATVLQAYLMRTGGDVERANREQIAIRLCKGAYAEAPEFAFQEKSAVDENYLRLAEVLLCGGTYPAFATHDEAMISGILKLVKELDLSPEDFEFQMLFGIRQDRQRELLEQGWRVRLYVPYGRSWYPYFMRRLAERPANLVFFLMALVKG